MCAASRSACTGLTCACDMGIVQPEHCHPVLSADLWISGSLPHPGIRGAHSCQGRFISAGENSMA